MDIENYFKNLRSLTKELKALNLGDASDKVALDLLEKDKKTTITDEDMLAINFARRFVDAIDSQSYCAVVSAIRNGYNNLQASYSYLLNIGYSENEVDDFFKKNHSAFSAKKGELEQIHTYLLSLGLTDEEVKAIFLKASELSADEVKERCECVMRHFNDKELLLKLCKGYLLSYSLYTNPVLAIETICTELGVDYGKKLLENEYHFLYQFKSEDYQRNFTMIMPHTEALEIIEKYKMLNG